MWMAIPGFHGLSVAVEFDVADAFENVIDFCQLPVVMRPSIGRDRGGVQSESAARCPFEGSASDAAGAVDAFDMIEVHEGGEG